MTDFGSTGNSLQTSNYNQIKYLLHGRISRKTETTPETNYTRNKQKASMNKTPRYISNIR